MHAVEENKEQTHKPSIVTLAAHARQGLILFLCVYVDYLHVCSILFCLVPGRPSITTVNPSTSSIFLSWSVPSGSVTSYIVIWTSEECPGGVLGGNDTISGSSLSHTITRLRGGTTYTITVTASNPAGTNTSTSMTRETEEYGE